MERERSANEGAGPPKAVDLATVIEALACGLFGLLLAAVLCALTACGGEPMNERLGEAKNSAWTAREELRVFYSGHSLSDGVPEVLETIAASFQRSLEFEVQTLGYSLLRERTKGRDPGAQDFSGYRLGDNRRGKGLDVAAELASPTRLTAGKRYDALVVTERHDLPAIAADEQTPVYLAHMAERLLAGAPEANVYFYHTWLDLNLDDPLPWVRYERSVRPLWECVASRANRLLGIRRVTPPIRVLPGATALVELVEALWQGKVASLSKLSPSERVRLLFRDNVHYSDLGRYYLALVHYAVLYGHDPSGAPLPPGTDQELGAFIQKLAFSHASDYGRIADAAASRNMETCRRLAQEQACPSYYQYRSGDDAGPIALLKRKVKIYGCQRKYADRDDPRNPFRSE